MIINKKRISADHGSLLYNDKLISTLRLVLENNGSKYSTEEVEANITQLSNLARDKKQASMFGIVHPEITSALVQTLESSKPKVQQEILGILRQFGVKEPADQDKLARFISTAAEEKTLEKPDLLTGLDCLIDHCEGMKKALKKIEKSSKKEAPTEKSSLLGTKKGHYSLMPSLTPIEKAAELFKQLSAAPAA